MEIRFDPGNPVIRLCMNGMMLEDNGKPEEALLQFQKAWEEAGDHYEQFIAAFHLSRVQQNVNEERNWLETSLTCAQKINDENVISAYPTLYRRIAVCCEKMGDVHSANKHLESAASHEGPPTDKGPFYHGTKAALKIGEQLTPGGASNYQPGLTMNHIYFTANPKGAGLAAALAKGEGRERVYIVEPRGTFEHDPNVTDKKFPGNLTRSYRSLEPLQVIGELQDWDSLTSEDRQEWKDRLDKNKGEIIN